MRNILIGLGAAAAIAAVGTAARAGTATGTLPISLTVTASCTVVSSPTLTFPSSGVLTANVDATTNITVVCTDTTTYDIGLDAGQTTGATVTTRKMVGTGGNTDKVSYALYSDTGRSANWGNTVGTDTVHLTGTGSNIATTVYGRVPPQASVKPDTYTDTVNITVTF